MEPRVCKSCSSTAFRRVQRAGWFECDFLTWLGYFPWECSTCRRKFYFKDDGRKPSARGHL